MKIFKILSLIAVFMLLLQSCSTEEEFIETTQAESIEISVDKTTFMPGDNLRINVITNNGDNVTTRASIFVDGVRMKGYTYTTPTENTRENPPVIHAEFEGLESRNKFKIDVSNTGLGTCTYTLSKVHSF